MRATLHDQAPNTYYGQWPRGKAAVPGFESPAIGHNKLVASARFVTFDVRSEISQEIARRRVGNLPVDQRKNLRARRSRALPATTTCSPLLSEATAL
jgi:hypothetical protein